MDSGIEVRFDVIEDKLNDIGKQVDRVHQGIYGVEGAGGLHRWVTDINTRVHHLEAKTENQSGRMAGIAIGVSVIVGAVEFLVLWVSK